MSKIHVSCTINGESEEFLCEARQSLLEVLREDLGFTGTKEGCNDGNCGACSVMIDGVLVDSCLVLAAEAEGREILTVEGLASADGLHPLQQKFLEHASLQCGICTPGVHRREPSPSSMPGAGSPTEGRHPPLAGRQPLPLHRLRQDRPRRALDA